MKTPKVSVVIPGKNSSETLRQCIESVVNQSYRKLEVIYVDNNSADNSIEIASEYPIKVISERRNGSFIARNTGARNASGEILVFIDSDCIAEEDSVERLVKSIIEGKEVSCMGSILSAEDNRWSAIEQKTYDNLIKAIKKRDYVSVAYSGNLAIKKSVFDELGGFDEKIIWNADIDFSLRLIKADYRIKYVAGAKVMHFHRTSIVTIFRRKLQQGYWSTFVYRKNDGEPHEYGRMIREVRWGLCFLGLSVLLFGLCVLLSLLGCVDVLIRLVFGVGVVVLLYSTYYLTYPPTLIYITKRRNLKQKTYQIVYFFGWRLGIVHYFLFVTPRKIKISRLIGKINPSFNNPPHIGELIRFLHFRDEIKKIEFHDVLDAGCGWGKYSFFLSKLNPAANIIGVDISDLKIKKERIEAQKRNIENVEFIKKDLLDLDYETKFDLIVCVDVIEHIKDDEKLIKVLYKALKPGGHIFIRTPRTNEFRFFSRFKDHWSEGHVRRGYQPDELGSMMEKHGFTIKKIRKTSGVFGALAWELDTIVRENVYIYHLMYPLFYMLSLLDVKFVGKTRFNGFYILAEKIPSYLLLEH